MCVWSQVGTVGCELVFVAWCNKFSKANLTVILSTQYVTEPQWKNWSIYKPSSQWLGCSVVTTYVQKQVLTTPVWLVCYYVPKYATGV